MSSVDPNVKESLRRREAGERTKAADAASRPRASRSTEAAQKPKAKEQEVLDVATEYFLKHGYQGASINAMARSSGISKESIYRYFSSKKQLFEAVIGRELMEYRSNLHRLDRDAAQHGFARGVDHGRRERCSASSPRIARWRCAA